MTNIFFGNVTLRYSGVNCTLRPSKSIRYGGFVKAGVCFRIFYRNSARLSNVVRYNGVLVIAGLNINIYL